MNRRFIFVATVAMIMLLLANLVKGQDQPKEEIDYVFGQTKQWLMSELDKIEDIEYNHSINDSTGRFEVLFKDTRNVWVAYGGDIADNIVDIRIDSAGEDWWDDTISRIMSTWEFKDETYYLGPVKARPFTSDGEKYIAFIHTELY